jgi:hypothetical protein
MPEYQFLMNVSVPADHPNAEDEEWWADAAHGALTEFGASATYSLVTTPNPEATVAVSLGDGATYECYARVFDYIAGQTDWQRSRAPGGLNVALNQMDVNILASEDDGLRYRVPTDNTWETFGEPQFIKWDYVDSIVIF